MSQLLQFKLRMCLLSLLSPNGKSASLDLFFFYLVGPAWKTLALPDPRLHQALCRVELKAWPMDQV